MNANLLLIKVRPLFYFIVIFYRYLIVVVFRHFLRHDTNFSCSNNFIFDNFLQLGTTVF